MPSFGIFYAYIVTGGSVEGSGQLLAFVPTVSEVGTLRHRSKRGHSCIGGKVGTTYALATVPTVPRLGTLMHQRKSGSNLCTVATVPTAPTVPAMRATHAWDNGARIAVLLTF